MQYIDARRSFPFFIFLIWQPPRALSNPVNTYTLVCRPEYRSPVVIGCIPSQKPYVLGLSLPIIQLKYFMIVLIIEGRILMSCVQGRPDLPGHQKPTAHSGPLHETEQGVEGTCDR